MRTTSTRSVGASMMRRFSLTRLPALLLLALAAGVASGQSLTQALAEAYRTNRQLLAQRALLRDRRDGAAGAGELAADGRLYRPDRVRRQRPSIAGSPTLFTRAKPSTLDLTATQQVCRGGRTAGQLRQAIATVEATRAQTLAAETIVFQPVAQAYLDVLRD